MNHNHSYKQKDRCNCSHHIEANPSDSWSHLQV
uniref:Uncharacterized protein n=1 Tax=Arundo donax TaxID=35708 RepID=A0A0A9JAM8_ARUDO